MPDPVTETALAPPERIGDLWVGQSETVSEWRVCFSEDDVLHGPYEITYYQTEIEARAFSVGYMTGATP